jgi:tRNA threonylcarbamoyladenosine biosynthesis protein TsaB
MDEMYAATYAFEGGQWTELQSSALVKPEDLRQFSMDRVDQKTQPWVMAGNVFAVYGERVALDDPAGAQALRLPALPTASAMLRLAPQLLAAGKTVVAEHALPSYIRDKVAKTTAERAAEKAAVHANATL